MPRITAIAAVAALLAAAAPQISHAEPVPTSCTMDPWTGKMNCPKPKPKPKPIPTNCTIDPWTGKMTCHKWNSSLTFTQ